MSEFRCAERTDVLLLPGDGPGRLLAGQRRRARNAVPEASGAGLSGGGGGLHAVAAGRPGLPQVGLRRANAQSSSSATC